MAGYLLTAAAEEDLAEIVRFIAQSDGVGRASHVLEAFLEAFDTLTFTPGMGYRREHLTGATLRWWPVLRFQVLYDPETDPLTVMRIVHGARDLDRIFGA